MKFITTIAILIISFLPAIGQGNSSSTFLQTDKKQIHYYAELEDSGGTLYKMGGHWDKVGWAYAIRRMEALERQPDGSYSGASSDILFRDGKAELVVTSDRKPKRYDLDTAINIAEVNRNLNQGYYIDSYIPLSEELNERYPMNHHSFREGYFTWEKLGEDIATLEHARFREFANKRIRYIKDSISKLQDRYTLVTNSLLSRVGTINYSNLKDSLNQLPIEYSSRSSYFVTVVGQVAHKRPEHFFRLAEDMPEDRDLIFSAAPGGRDVFVSLKAVQGHEEIKKEYLKYRRFNKTMPYKILGTHAVIVGLVVWLIVRR